MNHFIRLLTEDPIFSFFVLSFLFLFLFFLTYIVQYIYISYNLKGLCKIIFNDVKAYTLPLEPFDFYFISTLPLIFWREILNIKKNMKFKNLFNKDFYFKVEKEQLTALMIQHPYFFYIQYLVFIFGVIWLFFLILAVLLTKFF